MRAYSEDNFPVGRVRSWSWVRSVLEDGRVGGNTKEPEVVGHVVGEYSCVALDPLVQCRGGIADNVIEAEISLDVENVWKQGVVAQVFSDILVVDNYRDAEGSKLSAGPDARELENLGGSDGTSRENDFLVSSDGENFVCR